MLANIQSTINQPIDISYENLVYYTNFLDESFIIECNEIDYKFYVNYLTMIEMFGDTYHKHFIEISNFNLVSNDHIIMMSITNHIDSYLIVYQREKNINNILQ